MAEELYINQGEFSAEHEVVLQILQKEDIPAVQARLSTIPGKPVIYTLSHRGFKGFRGRSTETALKEINATQVGTMGDAWIDYMGRPKLKAKINVTDPDSETNIQTGEVLISDGYWHDPDTPYISSFDFDHLLIYPLASGIKQGEPAALILNQQPEVNSLAEKTEEPTSLECLNSILKTNQAELMDREKTILSLNQQIEAKEGIIVQKDKTISEKEILITNQTKEIEGYQKQLADIEAAEELKVNQALFDTYAKGVQDKFESRKSELGDPKTSKRLILEMNQEQAKVKVPEFTKAEGTKFVVNQTTDAEDAEAEAAWASSHVRL